MANRSFLRHLPLDETQIIGPVPWHVIILSFSTLWKPWPEPRPKPGDSFTGRHPRRRAEAWQRPRPSPCGTRPGASRRPGWWEEQGREQQRTPAGVVSITNSFRNDHCGLRDSTYELGVADELASEPEEGLLEVIVRLGRNIVVLEVLLAVEGDGLGLDLALLDIDLVTAENNGDVLANTDEIA
jgi:hypothetical protein